MKIEHRDINRLEKLIKLATCHVTVNHPVLVEARKLLMQMENELNEKDI